MGKKVTVVIRSKDRQYEGLRYSLGTDSRIRCRRTRGKMKAMKAEIIKKNAADVACEVDRIGQMGSPTWVRRIFAPPKREKGVMFKGEPQDTAKSLVSEIKDKGIL